MPPLLDSTLITSAPKLGQDRRAVGTGEHVIEADDAHAVERAVTGAAGGYSGFV